VIGVVAATSGVVAAAEMNTAPGATIVILALAVFIALAVGGAMRRKARTGARDPVATEPTDVVLHG